MIQMKESRCFIDDVLEGKPESLIVHVDTNDLTGNVNLLNNANFFLNKVKILC